MRYQVKKYTLINSPKNNVRKYIENFSRWNLWSPWTVVEPDCSIEITGTPNLPGHTMRWAGKVIGEGQITLSSSEDQAINYHLEFIKPFSSKAKVSFYLDEVGDQTRITWTMDSSIPFFLFFMVKTMKNWIGMDYERGLRMLKELAEKGEINCKTSSAGVVDYHGFSYLGIRRTVAVEDLPTSMKQDFEKIVKDVIIDRKLGAKQWVSIYEKFDMKNMVCTYIAAVSEEELKNQDLGSEYLRGKIKDGKALEIKHDGAYDFIGNAWSMGMMHMRAQKLKGNGYPFEQYWNSPMEVQPKDLKTSIYFPTRG